MSPKKGFTLAELLVVVGIIAVLVAIAIPTFLSSQERAKLAVDHATVRQAYALVKLANLTGEVNIDGVDTTLASLAAQGNDVQLYLAAGSSALLSSSTAQDVYLFQTSGSDQTGNCPTCSDLLEEHPDNPAWAVYPFHWKDKPICITFSRRSNSLYLGLSPG